jgi:hypothetical protein
MRAPPPRWRTTARRVASRSRAPPRHSLPRARRRVPRRRSVRRRCCQPRAPIGRHAAGGRRSVGAGDYAAASTDRSPVAKGQSPVLPARVATLRRRRRRCSAARRPPVAGGERTAAATRSGADAAEERRDVQLCHRRSGPRSGAAHQCAAARQCTATGHLAATSARRRPLHSRRCRRRNTKRRPAADCARASRSAGGAPRASAAARRRPSCRRFAPGASVAEPLAGACRNDQAAPPQQYETVPEMPATPTNRSAYRVGKPKFNRPPGDGTHDDPQRQQRFMAMVKLHLTKYAWYTPTLSRQTAEAKLKGAAGEVVCGAR